MKSRCLKIVLLILGLQYYTAISSMSFVNTIKGIGGSIEDLGKKFTSKSFWQKIGMGFGASPTGYVYSFTVQNDSNVEVYVGIQEMASAMGACFPKAEGAQSNMILPGQKYVVTDKEYYFEMTINPPGNKPSYHFPYQSSDVLYVQDCIQLPKQKHSTQMHHFRSYVGKALKNGHYVHESKAEYLGYSDEQNPKDKQASISLSGDIDALMLHNSTTQDFFVGYSSQRELKAMSKKECDVFFAPIEKNSFASFTPSKNNPLTVGTVGLFAKGSDQAFEVFSFPSSVYKGKKYTVEIYQDPGQKVSMGLQGIMPGHYDVALGAVKDITPVTGIIWYQDVNQLPKKGSLINLPGQLWLVLKGPNESIIEQVEVGTALEFRFLRPISGVKQWLYFIYVDSPDKQKYEQFVSRFAQGVIGKEATELFKEQSKKQVNLADKNLTEQLNLQDQAGKLPTSLLVAALQGSLQVNQGKIIDKELGVTGYLVGADVFLAQGVTANAPFYYTLAPSMQTSGMTPTSAVQNVYAYSFGTGKPPKGMPAVSKTVGIPRRKLPQDLAKDKISLDVKKVKSKNNLRKKLISTFTRKSQQ